MGTLDHDETAKTRTSAMPEICNISIVEDQMCRGRFVVSHLADVHPYPTVFDQLGLRSVVEIEDVGYNTLVQQNNKRRLSQPVIPIATSIGLVCV